MGITQKNIQTLNEKIIKLAKKDKLIGDTTDINIFHIYWLSNNPSITNKDLMNGKYKKDPPYFILLEN
ncbi:MAG: hypothetical protein DBY16_01620 [Coprobacter sp.]|nr:MAG: hypothetical protein DBY16_01620 [Coprobacter sp.]